MRWLDGSDIDLIQFSGEELCEKIAADMYKNDKELWFKCADFIQNALFIIDFDAVINMEGFPTPYYGYYTSEYYSKIIKAFKAIGAINDANIITEAGQIDSYYQGHLDSAKGTHKWNKIYDEFSEKLDRLEKRLYTNTDFDIWTLLYNYIEEQIRFSYKG